MRNYYVNPNNDPEIFRDVQYKGNTETYQFDARPWVAANTSLSTDPTWSIAAGQATVSGASLSTSVTSAQVAFSETGRNLVKVVFNTSQEVLVRYIDIYVKDPITQDNDGVFYT